ncbi:MAG TPA: hypothetical protein VIS30_05455 [Candidatus Deferrimicrobiaceae bacterium]
MTDPVFFGNRYQAKFLLRLALLLALGTSFLYLVLFAVFSRSLAGDFSSVFHGLRHFTEFLFPILAVSVLAFVLLVCGAVAVLCVYALHKVAGPIYRMERVLEGYLAGDPVRPVFFRQRDQAHPLAAEYNAFVAVLREDRKRWAAVLEHADRLCLQDQATCRAEMEKALAELESLLSKYR